MKYFLDTNIFLRHLTADHTIQSPQCLALMKLLQQGALEGTTSEAVIAEICYVLSSKALYGLSHVEIQTRLSPILSLKGLHLSRRKIFLHALDLYAAYNQLDFEDAINIAHMQAQNIEYIVSYDKDYDKVSTIKRVEPSVLLENASLPNE